MNISLGKRNPLNFIVSRPVYTVVTLVHRLNGILFASTALTICEEVCFLLCQTNRTEKTDVIQVGTSV